MLETKDILSLQNKATEALASIKGLETFREDDQTLLLKTYTRKELLAFISIYNGLNKRHTYQHKQKELYFCHPWGFCIGTTRDKMQMTDHTLYTFLTEHNYMPSEFVKEKPLTKDNP